MSFLSTNGINCFAGKYRCITQTSTLTGAFALISSRSNGAQPWPYQRSCSPSALSSPTPTQMTPLSQRLLTCTRTRGNATRKLQGPGPRSTRWADAPSHWAMLPLATAMTIVNVVKIKSNRFHVLWWYPRTPDGCVSCTGFWRQSLSVYSSFKAWQSEFCTQTLVYMKSTCSHCIRMCSCQEKGQFVCGRMLYFLNMFCFHSPWPLIWWNV